MNINATILGQMITFAIFVWINLKFIWPKIQTVLAAREQKILQGLQAAAQAEKELQQAAITTKEQIKITKHYCLELIDDAKKQAEHIMQQAINEAKQREAEIMQAAEVKILQTKLQVQQELRTKLAELIVAGTEKFITTHMDYQTHQKIFKDLSEQLYGLE